MTWSCFFSFFVSKVGTTVLISESLPSSVAQVLLFTQNCHLCCPNVFVHLSHGYEITLSSRLIWPVDVSVSVWAVCIVLVRDHVICRFQKLFLLNAFIVFSCTLTTVDIIYGYFANIQLIYFVCCTCCFWCWTGNKTCLWICSSVLSFRLSHPFWKPWLLL